MEEVIDAVLRIVVTLGVVVFVTVVLPYLRGLFDSFIVNSTNGKERAVLQEINRRIWDGVTDTLHEVVIPAKEDGSWTNEMAVKIKSETVERIWNAIPPVYKEFLLDVMGYTEQGLMGLIEQGVGANVPEAKLRYDQLKKSKETE